MSDESVKRVLDEALLLPAVKRAVLVQGILASFAFPGRRQADRQWAGEIGGDAGAGGGEQARVSLGHDASQQRHSERVTSEPKTHIPRLLRTRYLMDNEEIAIVPHVVWKSTLFHAHEFYELVYIESGRLLHRYGTARYEVRDGDLAMVNPCIPHAYDIRTSEADQPPARIWNILLTECALGALGGEPGSASLIARANARIQCPIESGPVSLPARARTTLGSLVRQMWGEFHHKEDGYRAVLRACLSSVLILAGRYLPQEDHLVSVHGHVRDVTEVIRYITDHCENTLRVADLARQFGWSPGHLNRRFKAVTGSTVGQYIGRVRATKAARLLLTEFWSVDEIARRVGYADVRAFRRAFARYYGTTPGAFRGLT